jgi:dipeptidyl aminopeptidase/acylaminoacyl peptidase
LFDLYDEVGDFGLHSKYKGDFKILSVSTNPNRNAILLRRSTVAEYPEVRLMTKQFKDEKVLSKTNPQQSQYNWATTELVKWKAYDGTPLEGILYKPADFDASKKYPLIAYFYELNSENLHNHLAPKSSPSVINPTEYASAGYLILIPDIRYQAGHPAKSAYNCIVSGTDYVVKNYPVDSTRLGLQGQSWGGYQTAQLITMTNKYAAAMAGAPVGNMFSAYGGIRWGSGLNRQFQYESAQSRIGKTIWEAPELYIENSPLFHLPKVKTPLLMMHNDKDGAVPWYQGIELYNGMRRLGKPCWLLNYNEDDHNLRKDPYKMDLSIRMRQFFDHYLQGKPMPVWMKSGIPAVEKGEKLGYELEEK